MANGDNNRGLQGLAAGFTAAQGGGVSRNLKTNQRQFGPVTGTLATLADSFLRAGAERKKRQDPLFDLREKILQQNATMNQIDIADKLMTREFEIKKARNDAALSQLKRLEAQRQMELAVAAEQFYREGSDFVLDAIAKDETLTPEFQKRYLEFTTRTPLINDARWAGLSKTVQKIQTLKRQQLRQQQAIESGMVQESVTVGPDGGVTTKFSQPTSDDPIEKRRLELEASRQELAARELDLEEKAIEQRAKGQTREQFIRANGPRAADTLTNIAGEPPTADEVTNFLGAIWDNAAGVPSGNGEAAGPSLFDQFLRQKSTFE